MNLDNAFQSFGEKFTPTDVSRPKNDANDGAPDQEKATQPVDVSLPDNPAGDRNEQKLVGMIAGQPSNSLLDQRVHFPVDTEEQAKAAINRVSRLRQSPDWYMGTVAELRQEVHAGIRIMHPELSLRTTIAEVTVKNPLPADQKEVPGVTTPSLENTGNKNDSRYIVKTLSAQASTEAGRKALHATLTENLKKKEADIKMAMKIASRLETDGLTGEEFTKMIDFIQSDVLHELIFQGVTASTRREELLARMKERQNG